MNLRNFENLRVWQEARLLVTAIYKMMQTCNDYGFRDQIQRASLSIMNNIAEGSESGSDKAYIRYLNIAHGSCAEVKSMLYLCETLDYCSSEKRQELQSKLSMVSSQIYKLTAYLKNNIK
ncbi:MAG: four helix bundle protein [Lentimicrobiaceae bacterium]|nr:four helix bundle protein [Lentimicrobiaceae bacterium]